MDLAPETKLSQRRKNFFAILILPLLLLILYSNTFDASWQFDDRVNILDRRSIHITQLEPEQIWQTFFNDRGKVYRPVASLSLALNYYFGKDNVSGYHLVNLIIHFFAAVFLFLFIKNMLNLPSLSQKYEKNSYSIALLATLLWAANPIQTQAVTYIVQRMASMAAMFYIMAMYFYLKGRMSIENRHRALWFAAATASGLMAMGSKENAFMLPAAIFVFEIFIVSKNIDEAGKKTIKVISLVVAMSMLLAVTYYLMSRENLSFLASYQFKVFSLKERLLTEPRIILFYLGLIFYPMSTRLSIQHDIALSKSLFDPFTTFLSIFIITTACLLAIVYRKKYPVLSFSLIFFFLNHIIESSVFPLELVFEHRNYLPSMFLFVPVATFLVWIISYSPFRNSIRVLIMFFIICIIIGLGHATYIRNFTWKTNESLWLDAVEKAPALWRPWHNLGQSYSSENMHTKALLNYEKALTMRTDKSVQDKYLTYYNMGVTYQKLGQKEEALNCYNKSIRIFPFLAQAHVNKASLLREKGLREPAVRELRKAIKLDNTLHNAYSNLGFELLKAGQIKNAIGNLETASKLAPENTVNLLRLGYAYGMQGSFGQAYLAFDRAYRLDTKNPRPLIYIAGIYEKKGLYKRSNEMIERFVDFSDYKELKNLLKELTTPEEQAHVIIPCRDQIMSLLSRALRNKADLFGELANELQKKRRATQKPPSL